MSRDEAAFSRHLHSAVVNRCCGGGLLCKQTTAQVVGSARYSEGWSHCRWCGCDGWRRCRGMQRQNGSAKQLRQVRPTHPESISSRFLFTDFCPAPAPRPVPAFPFELPWPSRDAIVIFRGAPASAVSNKPIPRWKAPHLSDGERGGQQLSAQLEVCCGSRCPRPDGRVLMGDHSLLLMHCRHSRRLGFSRIQLSWLSC